MDVPVMDPDGISLRLRNRAKALMVWIISGVLLAGLCFLLLKASDTTRWTFRYRQNDLNTIVARIKAAPIPLGTIHTFQVARTGDPTTVAPHSAMTKQEDVYKISVYHRNTDDYVITIVLQDQGHLGSNGLLYSDSPLELRRHSEGSPEVEGATLLPFVKEQLGPKWWYAYNDLD